MKQITTIFKKDARHLWPEILVTIILTAALVRIYPYTWAPSEPSAIVLQQVAVALLFLVPMNWWILITRLVQSESLVGDRQFWLTRPYEWKKLLAAKVLFLLTFLYLPLLIAQCILLVEAGFHPLPYVPGLLYNLLLITGGIVLPLIAIATVTGSFARTTLTLLGILIGILGLGVLGSVVPSGHAKTPEGDSYFPFILFLAVFLTVIVLQYATRRLWLARTILGSLLLFAIIGILIPTDDHSISKSYPPVASSQQPMHLTFAPDETHKVALYGYDMKQKEVTLALPFDISGISADRAVSLDNTSITIEAPNGRHWTSHWYGAFGQYYLPSAPATFISINVDRAFLDQVRSMPLNVTLSLAFTELQSEPTSQVSYVWGDFTVPGIGICSSPQDRDSFNLLSCRAPLRQPHLAYLQTSWSTERCTDSGSQPSPSANTPGSTWIGSTDSEPAEFSLAPVWHEALNAFMPLDEPDPTPPHRLRRKLLCPGAPITITPYHPLARTQTQITIPNLKIPPPAKAEVGVGGGIGVFGNN